MKGGLVDDERVVVDETPTSLERARAGDFTGGRREIG